MIQFTFLKYDFFLHQNLIHQKKKVKKKFENRKTTFSQGFFFCIRT